MNNAPIPRRGTRRRRCAAWSLRAACLLIVSATNQQHSGAVAAFSIDAPTSAPLLHTAATWVAATDMTQPLTQALGYTVLGTPAVALVQGAFLLGRYRLLHGDAPVPIVPSHGLVAVDCPSCDVLPKVIEKWEQEFVHHKEVSSKERDKNVDLMTQPLRLLVIGDSLAAGVGTAGSCTPVLPQSIARALSRDIGGRPVQWACLGEPGASAGWIVNELEKQDEQNQNEEESTVKNKGVVEDSMTVSFTLFEDRPKGNDKGEWDEWWQAQYKVIGKKLFGFDATDFGEYDVAVVLAGPNDFKMALLPFLTKSKPKKDKADFMTELMKAIEAVAENSKVELNRARMFAEKSMGNLHSSLVKALPKPISKVFTALGEVNEKESGEQNTEDVTPPEVGRPLIVLPSLPTKILPVLRPTPVCWFTPPILGVMDGIKSNLAKRYPRAVIFVEAPEDSVLEEFENEKGRLVKRRRAESDVLSLSAVPPSDCEKVLDEMQKYYRAKESENDQQRRGRQDEDTRVGQKGRVNPESPGESLFSVDKVHPNDAGYDFWGNYIASAIVEEWRTSTKTKDIS